MPEPTQKQIEAALKAANRVRLGGGYRAQMKAALIAAAAAPDKRRGEFTNTNCPVCHYWPCKCPAH